MDVGKATTTDGFIIPVRTMKYVGLRSRALDQVKRRMGIPFRNASGEDVVMDKDMKGTLGNDVEGFYDCRDELQRVLSAFGRGISHFNEMTGKCQKHFYRRAFLLIYAFSFYQRPAPIATPSA